MSEHVNLIVQQQAVDLLNRGLPKWPKHLVTGKPVVAEAAKEIIRRTDSFFLGYGGGNNHQYNRWVRELLGMPLAFWDRPDHRPLPPNASEAEVKARQALVHADIKKENEQQAIFDEVWKPISTEYIHNSWLSCAFIGGPHGWMHPDGRIGFVDNVGKWPSILSIYEDWKTLAEAFPFLEIGSTLFSGEECESGIEPVVSFQVMNGNVLLIDPNKTDVHAGHPIATRRYPDDDYPNGTMTVAEAFKRDYGDPRREQGVPDSWIFEWSAQFKLGWKK